MFDDMQSRRVIEGLESPWLSLVVQIRKKNEGLRFCMDYRKMNDVKKKHFYIGPD
jgi:hypothetical protein